MNRNIEMNYRTESGYEVLYPKTTIAQVNSLQSQLNQKLNLSGGTMTGPITLSGNGSGNQAISYNQMVSYVQSYLNSNYPVSIVNRNLGSKSGSLSSGGNQRVEFTNVSINTNVFMLKVIVDITNIVGGNNTSSQSVIEVKNEEYNDCFEIDIGTGDDYKNTLSSTTYFLRQENYYSNSVNNFYLFKTATLQGGQNAGAGYISYIPSEKSISFTFFCRREVTSANFDISIQSYEFN